MVDDQNGLATVIEAKSWPATKAAIRRAIEQASRYRQLTRADRAIIVLPEVPRRLRRAEVVGIADLPEALAGGTLSQRSAAGRKGDKRAVGAKKKGARRRGTVIFAAIPFAMAGAAEKLNATCVRVDREEFVGDIPSRIRTEIRRCAAVIADVSDASPNVLYETGFAHALRKPTVHICSTPLDKMPFDVSHDNTLTYVKGQTYHLRDKLQKRLESVL